MNAFNILIFSILLINCDTVFSLGNKNNRDKPRIVIVGAGAAGIAAASKLFENGFENVTILEAEKRIGGRIHTTQFGDHLIDLGAQWIHGEIGNLAFELASPYDVLDYQDTSNISNSFSEQQMLDSTGNFINNATVFNLLNFYDKIFEAHVIRDNVESVGEYARKKFFEEFKNEPEILKRSAAYLHLLELFATNYDPADSWNDLSARGFSEYKKYPGNQTINWKSRGYSTILDILMKRYPDPKKELPIMRNTHLNCEVRSINYSKNLGKSEISVVTTKGQKYSADHVIVTVSLGVLKEKHQSLFNPPLSREKVKTIESLGFGNVGKVFLYFEQPFSQEEAKRLKFISFVWSNADRSVIKKTEKAWTLGIMDINTVEYKPNVLELWISGRYAKQMEKVSKQKVFEHTLEFLHQFMGKQFNITPPVAIMRTQWFSNPHFRGTYSYRSVKTQRNNIYPSMLQEPLSTIADLNILFAGEATSEHRFSTVDGAIGSGWEAAERLINFYKNLSSIL